MLASRFSLLLVIVIELSKALNSTEDNKCNPYDAHTTSSCLFCVRKRLLSYIK